MTRILISILICFAIVPKVLADGASQAASNASKSQSGAQMASQLMGAAMAATCAMQPPPPSCPLGLLALIQAGNLGDNSKDSEQAAAALASGTSGASSASSTGLDTTAGGSTGGTSATMDTTAARASLAKLGYSLSPDDSQLTTPNGATMPTSSFSSAGGMAAAGFSESAIRDAQATIAKAQADVAAKMGTKSLEADGGGGGGGGFGGSDRSGGRSNVVIIPGLQKNKPGALPISGMTKNFGGDRIGVAGDDIFQMITRRYRAEDLANGFIKN